MWRIVLRAQHGPQSTDGAQCPIHGEGFVVGEFVHAQPAPLQDQIEQHQGQGGPVGGLHSAKLSGSELPRHHIVGTDARDLESRSRDHQPCPLIKGHGLDPGVAPQQIRVPGLQLVGGEGHQFRARTLALEVRVGSHAAQPVLLPTGEFGVRFRIERSNANAVLTDVDAQVESSYQSIVGEVDILFQAAGPKHLEAQRIGVRCFDEEDAHQRKVGGRNRARQVAQRPLWPPLALQIGGSDRFREPLHTQVLGVTSCRFGAVFCQCDDRSIRPRGNAVAHVVPGRIIRSFFNLNRIDRCPWSGALVRGKGEAQFGDMRTIDLHQGL